MITNSLTSHCLYDVQHLVAMSTGLLLGLALRRRSPEAGWMVGVDG